MISVEAFVTSGGLRLWTERFGEPDDGSPASSWSTRGEAPPPGPGLIHLMKGFARREFQLVLLRRMADYQPDLVVAAMRSLDASRTEMRQVNARWQRILRSSRFPGGERRLRMVLGPPADGADRRLGDVTCRTDWWDLPLWPDLRFEALIGPDGTVLHEWLVRPEGSPPPRLESVADLTPWSCVVSDVAERFAPASHQADTLPSRWQVTFSAPDARPYVAHFAWGLLQTVEEHRE